MIGVIAGQGASAAKAFENFGRRVYEELGRQSVRAFWIRVAPTLESFKDFEENEERYLVRMRLVEMPIAQPDKPT